MNDSKISCENLDLYFGTKQVLKKVSIKIPEKEVVALIGPSGCGKSTLLRSFNRMHDLNHEARIEGVLKLEAENLYDPKLTVNEIRKKIGMVFQKPNPLPMSIFDNVAYGLRIHNHPENEIKEMVEKALQESYLWDEVKNELKKPAVQLSGGQQQRLCIARTVVLRPEVILMDEPCSALDPISTSKIEELITELKKEYTVVIVTHNMQQAQRVADKVAFMYLGELIEYDLTETVFKHPKHELTKNYVNGHFG